MSKEKLINWLQSQQPVLEEIILKAAEEYYNAYSKNRIFPYDAKKTGEELWLLGRGEDLCYDRPTIAFNYSLWYHPKRINTFLRYFTDLIYDSRDEHEIQIFDLGAGTGAVLWAVALVSEGLRTIGLNCPKIRVINVDTSPFMILYNYHYLWKHFITKYPKTQEISNKNDYRLNSWSNLEENECNNVWICASYLFDHSENAEAIADDFKSIIEKYRPNKILLLSSTNKKVFCDAVANSIQQKDFIGYSNVLEKQIFSGPLTDAFEFRRKISQQYSLNLTGTPMWNIDSLYGRILVNKTPQLVLNFDKINLYIPPQKNRKLIRLTKQQEDASSLNYKPTLIVGPAGCGKSVVLTQKVKNIIDASKIDGKYDPNTKILITTFNKGLVKYLGDWIEQLLDPGTFTRTFDTNMHGNRSDFSFFSFSDPRKFNIFVMHFDILPTRIGSIPRFQIAPNGADIEEFHYKRMASAANSYVLLKGVDQKKFAKILDPEFLLDEYHRIIYGLQCDSYNNTKKEGVKYATVPRDGRGRNPQLKLKSERRKIVWGIINTYLTELRRDHLESFTVRRHRFIKNLNSQPYPYKFKHLIVDEFQDCTKTDYDIFYHLLEDPNNLTLAGDIAQSIHLGAALHIPKADDQRRFSHKKLEGSFRLPFRVSECIRPLSQRINAEFGDRHGVQADIINPYKGAPPGSRPILLFAKDTIAAADKIAEVFFAYKDILKLDNVSIYERDRDLNSEITSKGISSETDIILRTKGLEKKCVVWSTRINVDTQNEITEFIYTIFTRTVSLLILVVFPDIKHEYVQIIKELVPNRLILWDEESEMAYFSIKQASNNSTDVDDIDNSSDIEQNDEDDINDLVT